MNLLFAFALITLSLIGGSLPIMDEARAQEEPQATEVPGLTGDPPVDVDQAALAQVDPPATEVPGVVDDPALATETVPQLVEPTVISIEPETDPTAAGDPEPEPTAVATEVTRPVIPAEPSLGDPDGDPTIGRVTVVKLTCSVDIARSDALSTLFDQCGENPGPVEFSVTGNGGYSQSAFTPDDVRQIVTFTDVPFGEIAISETVPAGYGGPLAFCSDSAADGPGTFAPVTVVGGNSITVEHRADAEEELRCVYVNFPEGGETEPEAGVVTISKLTCPAGVARTGVDYFLSDVCRENPGPVEFSVTDNAGYSRSAFTSDDVSQYVMFADVPFGDIEISETIPAGFGEPLVFCADTVAVDPREFVPVPVIGGNTIAWEHRADAESSLRCGFVNFQEGGEDIEPDTGVVRISKYTCPEGVARTDNDYLLSEQCREDVDPVSFTISDDPVTFSKGASATGDAPQEVEITDIPFGEIVISETMPAGYGEPLAFCADTPAEGEGNYESVPVVDGNTIFRELRADAGIPLTCLFFNFMDGDDDGNVVTLQKWLCPAGIEIDGTLEDFLDQCAEPFDGAEFSFADGNGANPEAHFPVAGFAEWTGVTVAPEGALGLSEDLPPGFDPPVVFCGEGGLYNRQTLSGTLHELYDIEDIDDFEYRCHWFNIPREDSIVELIKFTCPEGYDLNAWGADPEADCAATTNGVTFTLADTDPATADQQAVTGVAGDGAVSFEDLTPGQYTVTESMPEGTALAFVLDCYGQIRGELRPYPLSLGDTLELEVHGGEHIVCFWYNVPKHDNTSLTLVKYTCSTETYVSDVDCEIDETGQTFDLVVWNGAAWEYHSTATTDGQGRIHWPALNPLEYWLDEQDGDWCHLSSEQLSGNGDWIDLYEDQETVVNVYNCDGVPGKPGETPTKYPNTGVRFDGHDDRRPQP